jgi:P27 family predicted phage terminase small subunit
MITGPKPKAAEVAAAQGNPGHRPVRTTPVDASPLDATAPEWLDDMGRAVWTAHLARLRSIGFVKSTDLLTFARYCDHTSRWLRIRDRVNARGESYTTESKHGSMDRINPDFAAMLRLESLMVQMEDRFGLSPAARQQILARLTDPGTSPDLSFSGFGAPAGRTQSADAPSPLGLFAPRPSAEGSGGTH